MAEPTIVSAEPVAVATAFVSAGQAVIALLVGLEVVAWTPAQVGLVEGVVVAATGLAGLFVRGRVTPVPVELRGQ